MNDKINQTRREMLGAAATLALLTAAPAATSATPTATKMQTLAAFQTSERLQPLSFDPAKLKGISERLIRSHWKNNYGGSVKALATVNKHLADALASKDTPAFIYNELKREHLLRTGSVVLHELYFNNLGGNGQADADVRKPVTAAFGSFNTWEMEFRRIAAGLSGGSGWVVLGYNLHSGKLENYWMADHAHGAAASLPLLVMDMYEHSYQMDYGAAADKYIDAFFNNIQWETVAARFSGLPKPSFF